MAGEAERRLRFRHGPPPPPPPGKGDAVSRVWALSPPGTTDWAACGRRVSGAWSVARPPPPPPPAPHSTPAGVVRARTRTPASPWPYPGTHLGRGVVRGLARWPQGQPQ